MANNYLPNADITNYKRSAKYAVVAYEMYHCCLKS
jgi:hypothetical protein